LSRTENNKLLSIIRDCPIKINPDFVFYFVDKFKSKSLSGFKLLKLKCSISSELKAYKRFQGLNFWLKLLSSHLRTNNLSKAFLRTRKKRLPNGGIFFALVGADGSGKTTLCKDLVKWLQWKLDVDHIYFGIPKESSSYRIKKRPAVIFNSLTKRFYRFKFIKLGNLTKRMNQIFESLLWLSIANLRKRNFEKSMKNSEKGIITIAERYPLKDLWSMETPMDGPRIKNDHLGKTIRTKERETYEKIDLPDRVFVLKVDINELRKRKNDLGYSSHKQKEDAINKLPKRSVYKFINANENYDQVLLQLKRLLWEDL
jgi:thymidylate kinase